MDFPIKLEPELNIKDEVPDNYYNNATQFLTVIHDPSINRMQEKEETEPFIFVKREENEIHDQIDWEPTLQEEKICCDICNKCFKTVHGLNRHYKVHTKVETKKTKTRKKIVQNAETLVKCEVCPIKLSVKYYSTHMNKKHKDSVPLQKCQLCPKSMRGKFLLDKHFKYAHANRELPCNECEVSFRNKFELHRHIKAVHFIQEPSRRAECEKCGIRYEPENARTHTIICKSSKRMKYAFTCLECRKLFQTEIAMVRHMPSHGTESYECDVCSRTYPALAKMKQHLLTTHFKKTPVIPCKFCPQVFNKRKFYIEHIPKCHTTHLAHKCDICDKVLKNALNLRRHKQSVHTSVKQFKCEICQTDFNRKSNLIHHMLVHFKYPFTCGICPKLCKTEAELEQHRIQHLDPTGLECKECLMIFKQKESLENHIKFKHRPHNKFSCEYCGKQFSYKPGLRMHLRNYLIKRNCNIRRIYKKKGHKTNI